MKYQVRIVYISCGFTHSLLLSELGNLYTLGNNKFGQLGLGKVQKMIKPGLLNINKTEKIWKIAAGAYHSIVVTSA